MIGFFLTLLGLVLLTLIYQLLSNLKVVGANELAVIAGKGREGFTTLRGGRVFVWPLVHRFFAAPELSPCSYTLFAESHEPFSHHLLAEYPEKTHGRGRDVTE